MNQVVNILITGAGGAAAVSVFKALNLPNITCFMADIDPYAAGLYLVSPERRILLPRGDHKAFIPTLLHACQSNGIDVLIPTVETEFLPISKYRNLFEFDGTQLMLAPQETLDWCLDKWTLLQTAKEALPPPRTTLLTATFDPTDWTLPVIAKPRKGSGSNGIHLIESWDALALVPKDGSYIIQAYLPGPEYSVDVFATAKGKVMAAVPRERLKIDSGIAVAARVRRDPTLEKWAMKLAERLKLAFCANVQFKLDHDGTPRLLEINARFPGTMPLTVAAGINMPLLCLKSLYGETIHAEQCKYKEIAVMRYLQETIVPSGEVEALEKEKAYMTHPDRYKSTVNSA